MTAAEPAEVGLPLRQRIWAIGAMSLGTGLLVVDNAIANVALPTLAEALSVAPSQAVVVVTVYQLVLLMALLPLSALGDRIGLRRMYQAGQLLFLIGTGVTVTADGLPHLLTGRALQALGAAGALSVSSALLRSVYPAWLLGRGLGLNGLIIAAAGAAAPTLGGLLLAEGSWRWVFAAAAPFAALSLVLGAAALPRPAPRPGGFDLWGGGLCALSFGLLFGGVELIVHQRAVVVGPLLLTAGAATLWLFVRRERGAERPILPVDLLAQARFALPAAAGIVAFAGSMAFMIGLPFRLQAAGEPPEAVGAILAVWPVAMMASAAAGGWLADKAPSGVPGAMGMLLAAAGLALAALTPADAGLRGFALPLALGGAGYGLFISPNAHLMIGGVPRDRAAAMGAVVSSSRLVGQTLGATLAAALLAASLGPTPAVAAVAAALALVACAASTIVFLVARKSRTVRHDGTLTEPL